MYKYTFSFFFLLLVTTVVQGQGILEFKEEAHEFPPFVVGETVTHLFSFKNIGDAPIIISKVDAGCGCTNIKWSENPIMPQDSGFVSVSYDSKGHEGNFFKNVHVYSNAKRPDYPLLIRGLALPDPKEAPLALLPQDTFALGKILKWTQLKQKVEVQNTGKNYLKISKVTSACNCVHLVSSAAMKIQAGETKTIELMYNPQEVAESHREEVILHTNSSVQPKISLFLESKIVGKRLELGEDGK